MATENEKLRKNNKDLKRWLDEKDAIILEDKLTIEKMNMNGAKVLAELDKKRIHDGKQRAIVAETKRKLKLANETIAIGEAALEKAFDAGRVIGEDLKKVKTEYRNVTANHDFSKMRVEHLSGELDTASAQIDKARLAVETLVAVNHPNLNLEPAFRMIDGMSVNLTPRFDNAVEHTLFHVHSLLK